MHDSPVRPKPDALRSSYLAPFPAPEGITSIAGVYRQAADDAYRALSGTDASIPGCLATNLAPALRRGVEMASYVIEETTSNASAVLKFISKRFQGAEKGAVTFSRIEAVRHQINRLSSAAYKSGSGPDQIAIKELKQGFDTWTDRLFTRALLDGDQARLGKTKTAQILGGVENQLLPAEQAGRRWRDAGKAGRDGCHAQ